MDDPKFAFVKIRLRTRWREIGNIQDYAKCHDGVGTTVAITMLVVVQNLFTDIPYALLWSS